MVCLIIETPLTYDQVRASVLDALDHIRELLLFILAQLLVLLDARDVEFVLRLRPWGLERACQNSDLRVLDAAGHLRVRHVLVDKNTLDEGSVCERAADLAIHLDEIERHVFPFEVRDSEHRVYGNLRKLLVLF